MSFVNPYFIIALAAGAVPILIHLLTRDRVRREAFSTLRFFEKASRRVLRRKRLREMILLAMRVAACMLLALAFARPFFEEKKAEGVGGIVQAATARVIVVDTSASMGRPGLLEAAKKEAESALGGLAPGADAAALITFAESPRLEAPLADQFSEVRSKIRGLAVSSGGTNIAEALRKADSTLKSAVAAHKEIVLVSDLQKTGWRTFKGDWKLSPGTKLTVKGVAAGAADVPAIIEADVPSSLTLDGLPRTLAVRVANYSAKEMVDLPVVLTLGDKAVDTQKVRIRPGESVPVRFRTTFKQPGDNPGTIAAGKAEAALHENVFYFNARVIPRIRVAVLTGGAPVAAGAAGASTPASDPGFFIEKALAPTADSPFAVKRVAAATATAADLEGCMVAIMADAKDVSADAVRAMAALLKRGGGILFVPGGSVEAEGFNRTFADLAPCKLRDLYKPPVRAGETPGLVLAKIDFEHPVFEVFQHPHYGDLASPRFRQFWEVGDSQLARVLARYEDGKPAILEREIGAGVSMMLTSPMDLKWNTMPLRAIFLPYLHQTVRYLAVRSERRTLYQVGDTLPVAEGGTLKDPAGKTHKADDAVAALPGFYALTEKDGGEPFQFAVNLDPAEADPTTVTADQLAAAVTSPQDVVVQALSGGESTSSDDREKSDRGIWWYLAAGLVLLSIAELFVANRTQRH